LGLYGMLPSVATNPVIALHAKNSTMIGVGLTMEGINQNYIVYDLILEMGWRTEEVNVTEWTQGYALRRYGQSVSGSNMAWDLLQQTVYSSNRSGGVTKSMIIFTPNLHLNRDGFMPTNLFYDPAVVPRSLKLLLNASSTFSSVPTYLYDVVDVTRQMLSDLFLVYQQNFTAAYNNNDFALAKSLGATMLDIITDMESILATNDKLLFGRWILAARNYAHIPSEGDWLEFNARNQVTLWGPKGEITDYASKLWSGLIKGYYLPRWTQFVTAVLIAMATGKGFDQGQFDADILIWEQDWQSLTDAYPLVPTGDTIQIANQLYQKYFPAMLSSYGRSMS